MAIKFTSILLVIFGISLNSIAVDKSLLPNSISDPFKSYKNTMNNDISADGNIRLSGIIIRVPNNSQIYTASEEIQTPLTYLQFDPNKDKIKQIANQFHIPINIIKKINRVSSNDINSSQNILIPTGIISKLESQRALKIDISINALKNDFIVSEEQIAYLKDNQLLGIGSIITTDLQKPYVVEEMLNAKTLAKNLKMSVSQLFELNPFLLDEPASTIGMSFNKKNGMVFDGKESLIYRSESIKDPKEVSAELEIPSSLINVTGERTYEINLKDYVSFLQNQYVNPHFFALLGTSTSLVDAHFLSDSISRNVNISRSNPEIGWKIGAGFKSIDKSPFFKVEYGPFESKSGVQQFCNIVNSTNKCRVVTEFLDKRLESASDLITSVVVLNQDEKFLVLDNEDKGYSGITIESVERTSASLKISDETKTLELKAGKVPIKVPDVFSSDGSNQIVKESTKENVK